MARHNSTTKQTNKVLKFELKVIMAEDWFYNTSNALHLRPQKIKIDPLAQNTCARFF